MIVSENLYDYVVVGAGSAGCLLANRLSADPEVRVALIEAGPSDNWHWIHIPAGTRSVAGNPRTDWCGETEHEPVLGRKTPVLRGRVLGGSSSINGTVYTRGIPHDYDHWRQLGLTGWSWEDVLPYFRRHERFVDGKHEALGCGGELHIERPRVREPVFDILGQAAEQVGLARLSSFNGGRNDGFGLFDVTQRRGRRWSSARAFLTPVRHRSNLTVLTDAHCIGLTFDGARTSGARVVQSGVERILSVRREVVLSSGAVGTPAILMHSGIGPGDVLRAAGVTVRRDRPRVGGNLQDHLSIRLAWRVHGVSTINTRYHNLFKRALIGAEYLLRGSGPMTMGAPLWGGFMRTDEQRVVPNIQYLMMPFTVTGATSFAAPDHFDGVSCGAYNLHPRSRGRVWITSPDPLLPPAILHNYLTDLDDQQVAIDAIKLMRKIAAQPAFQALRPEEIRPGAESVSDDELLACAIAQCGTAYHQTCTCAMGHDDEAVVDERLRVRGVEGLRIADGSVLPTLISGNTNACIMMIAEKAADMILQDARQAA